MTVVFIIENMPTWGLRRRGEGSSVLWQLLVSLRCFNWVISISYNVYLSQCCPYFSVVCSIGAAGVGRTDLPLIANYEFDLFKSPQRLHFPLEKSGCTHPEYCQPSDNTFRHSGRSAIHPETNGARIIQRCAQQQPSYCQSKLVWV